MMVLLLSTNLKQNKIENILLVKLKPKCLLKFLACIYEAYILEKF